MLLSSTLFLSLNVCVDLYCIHKKRIMSLFITERYFLIFSLKWLMLLKKVTEIEKDNSCFVQKEDYIAEMQHTISNHFIWTVSGIAVCFGLSCCVTDDWMKQKLTIAEQSANIGTFLNGNKEEIRRLAIQYFKTNKKTVSSKTKVLEKPFQNLNFL